MVERVEDSNDTGIESYIRILNRDFDIVDDDILNNEDVKKNRDDLATSIGSVLRYRDTEMATLDVTQEDFIKNYNFVLEKVKPNLVIDNFKITEQKNGSIEYHSISGENNGIAQMGS